MLADVAKKKRCMLSCSDVKELNVNVQTVTESSISNQKVRKKNLAFPE